MIKKIKTKNTFSIVYVILIISFIIKTSFLAINVKNGIPPDELFHVHFSEIYKTENLGPIKTITPDFISKVGNIYRTDYLYHYISGKILYLNVFGVDNYLWLRVFNIGLSILTVIIGIYTISLISRCKLTKFLTIIITTNTLMFTFISSSVNYDNLVSLLSITLILLIIKYIQKQKIKYVFYAMILCLAGSLVKKVFPIISVIALLLLFVVFAIKKTKITPVLKNILSQKNIIFLIPLLYLNFQLWGVNLVKYKTLMPSCEQITSHETCLQNQLYNRNFKLREKAQSTKKRMNVSDYLSFFQNRMLSTIYGIFAHKSIVRKNQDLTFYKLIFSIATISFIRKIKPKKNLVDLILFLYSFFFVSSMILVIRSVYAWSNVPDLGAQGRYLFPIIIPFYYLVSKYLLLITNNKIIKFSIFLIVACYFIGNSFPYFIKNTTPGWFQ